MVVGVGLYQIPLLVILMQVLVRHLIWYDVPFCEKSKPFLQRGQTNAECPRSKKSFVASSKRITSSRVKEFFIPIEMEHSFEFEC